MYALSYLTFDPFSLGVNFIYLVMLILALVAWIVRQMKERAGQSWPTVYGTVESTQVAAIEGKLRAEVYYSYSVEGEFYSGIFFRFPNSERSGERIVAPFTKGSSILVHYKPGAPDTSVLDLHEVKVRSEQAAMPTP